MTCSAVRRRLGQISGFLCMACHASLWKLVPLALKQTFVPSKMKHSCGGLLCSKDSPHWSGSQPSEGVPVVPGDLVGKCGVGSVLSEELSLELG